MSTRNESEHLGADLTSFAIAWFTDEHLTDESATTYKREVAERWLARGWRVTPMRPTPEGGVADAWFLPHADMRWATTTYDRQEAERWREKAKVVGQLSICGPTAQKSEPPRKGIVRETLDELEDEWLELEAQRLEDIRAQALLLWQREQGLLAIAFQRKQGQRHAMKQVIRAARRPPATVRDESTNLPGWDPIRFAKQSGLDKELNTKGWMPVAYFATECGLTHAEIIDYLHSSGRSYNLRTPIGPAMQAGVREYAKLLGRTTVHSDLKKAKEVSEAVDTPAKYKRAADNQTMRLLLERAEALYTSYGLVANPHHGLDAGRWINDVRDFLDGRAGVMVESVERGSRDLGVVQSEQGQREQHNVMVQSAADAAPPPADSAGWPGPGHARLGDRCPDCERRINFDGRLLRPVDADFPKLVGRDVPGTNFQRLHCSWCAKGSYGLHYPGYVSVDLSDPIETALQRIKPTGVSDEAG